MPTGPCLPDVRSASDQCQTRVRHFARRRSLLESVEGDHGWRKAGAAEPELEADIIIGVNSALDILEGQHAVHDDSVHYFVLVDQLEWQTGGSVNGGQLDVFGKPDPEREIGAGLSPAGAGLRLRYEIRGELAPYVGVSWTANSSARLISPGRREKTPAEPLWCLVFGHGSDSARVENRARVSSGGRINVERCGVKCGLMRSRHPPAEPCRQSHARTRHRNLLPG